MSAVPDSMASLTLQVSLEVAAAVRFIQDSKVVHSTKRQSIGKHIKNISK